MIHSYHLSFLLAFGASAAASSYTNALYDVLSLLIFPSFRGEYLYMDLICMVGSTFFSIEVWLPGYELYDSEGDALVLMKRLFLLIEG